MSQADSYLIMAGGTGGHIFPAMAVARSLIEKGAKVHWLGTASGMEHNIVPAENIPLHLITIKGFRGKGLLAKLLTPYLLLKAVWQSIVVLRKVKPKVVVGFGGYVAAPGGIAARLLGKKLIIHEQNSVAGSTNKLLAKIASKTLVAFPRSLPGALLIGNPIRSEVKELFETQKIYAEGKQRNLLVMGGSLGAEAINTIVPESIEKIPASIRPNIWHQTGKNKLQMVVESYKSLNIEARSEEFISDVAEAYRWADIIICRAGALTVSEVAVAGLPAIFIPYPYAIDNHQSVNAQWLVDYQAAYAIEQKELTNSALGTLLEEMLTDNALLQRLSRKLKEVSMPDATEKMVAICEQACSGKSLNGGRRHAA